MIVELALIVAGCGLLFFGGDWLVDGISKLASHFNVPPFILAFVVMGFGTSAPELFVAVDAMFAEAPDIAVGNVVGSNIANLLLVLALAALIAPLTVDRNVLHFDGIAMMLIVLLASALAFDGLLSRFDGAVLFIAMLAYLALRWQSLVECEDGDKDKAKGWVAAAGLCIAALVALPLGAHWFIEGAVALAQRFGVSHDLIGLTVVAVGTSLPEIAACVAAAVRRHANMILGGILGSNVFNSTIVLSGAVLVAPVTIAPSFQNYWIPVMICASMATVVFLRTDFLLSRREAIIMLTGYLAIFSL